MNNLLKNSIAVVIFLFCIITIIIFSGCGQILNPDPPVPPTPYLSFITVAPTSASLFIGSVESFTARGYDQNSNVMAISPSWTVTGDVGTVTSSGTFSAVSEGIGKVVASDSGISGKAAIIIANPNVFSITVSPPTAVLSVGDTAYFSAQAFSKNGTAESCTPSWSATGGIGIIYSSGKIGVFTATTVGAGTVIASYNTVTTTISSAIVTVNESTGF